MNFNANRNIFSSHQTLTNDGTVRTDESSHVHHMALECNHFWIRPTFWPCLVPTKAHDDISNDSGVIVLADATTHTHPCTHKYTLLKIYHLTMLLLHVIIYTASECNGMVQ